MKVINQVIAKLGPSPTDAILREALETMKVTLFECMKTLNEVRGK